jgi:tetratricopeptide (TPR) repeat protein
MARHGGRVKIGPYETLGELGRGAMGVVFRVRSPAGAEVALKTFVRIDEAAFARFERERRLLGSLGPEQGFVGLLDAGKSAEGVWLVMPLVAGGTLRQRLEAGPLGVAETVDLGARLATALGLAHERGIVHRDVKPENVLFTREGRPLIADLGLAKHFDRGAPGASQSVSLSTAGSFRGTVGYMAPEQFEDAKNVGPPSDVFALGAVLYECLAGRPAFPGESVVELVARVGSGKVEPIGRKEVPPALEAIVRRALATDPRRRFADGASLARALREFTPRRSRLPRLGLALVVPILLVVRMAWREHTVAGLREAALEKHRASRWADEIEDLSRLIELEPNDAWAWAQRGAARNRADDLDASIADATKAIELDPGLALGWETRGRAKNGKGDGDGAIADSTRAIELDPKVAWPWLCRASARDHKYDREGAILDATRALELDPTFAPAWAVRGGARGVRGDIDGGIADTTRAIELDPKLAPAWIDRGLLRSRKGDLEGHLSDARRATELAPRSAVAWTSRAEAANALEQRDDAIVFATRAIELDPRIPQPWCHRGIAKGLKGDAQGEIDDQTHAIELWPDFAEAWRDRAVAKDKLGDVDGAIADLERYLELVPEGADADKVRLYIEQRRAMRAGKTPR